MDEYAAEVARYRDVFEAARTAFFREYPAMPATTRVDRIVALARQPVEGGPVDVRIVELSVLFGEDFVAGMTVLKHLLNGNIQPGCCPVYAVVDTVHFVGHAAVVDPTRVEA